MTGRMVAAFRTDTGPDLDDIRRDPGVARTLSAEAARDLLFDAELVTGVLRAAVASPCRSSSMPEEDELLDIKAAADFLGVSADWLYRRSKRLPFVVRVGSRLRFSRAKLKRWIQARGA